MSVDDCRDVCHCRPMCMPYMIKPTEAEEADVIAEVEHERIWRERCAEPAPGRYPVRCRRDLNHPDGHVGVGSRIISEIGERPMRWETTYVRWRGLGNSISAKVGNFRCWCTLKQEPPTPSWAITEHPRGTV